MFLHRPLFRFVLILAGLFLAAVPAIAIPSSQPVGRLSPGSFGPIEHAGERVRLPLEKIMSYAGPIRLERVRSEATVPVPVNLRMTVKSARLRLYLSNSIALIKRRSQLAIVLNDRVITQIPLDGGNPTSVRDIALPPDVFQADFNRLTFRVAQHYVIEECEDPFAPELWTEIDTVRSAVTLDVVYRPIVPRLADLGEVFSPKDPAPRSIAIMSASNALLDEAALRTGTLLAQGVALRLRFVPLEVVATPPRRVAGSGLNGPLATLDPAAFGPRDGILYGTIDQLAPFVGPTVVAGIRGPFLGIYPMPAAPWRMVLVVSGRDESELRTAATAFAFLDSPFPDAASALVRDITLPEWPKYGGRNVLAPGRTYEFKDLGFQTRTLNGLDKDEAELTFSLPPDVWVLEDDKLPIRLHFSHGANFAPNSVINLFVNRKFADAIPVRENRARVHEGYMVELPLRLFRPGDNSLTIVPRFLPEGEGACKPMPTDGLLMTLFKDSTLTLPNLPHFTDMPNLDLLARTGFPYTRSPDGRGSRLWVGGSDRPTLSAAWTVIGRLAQTTGMPLFRMEASFDPPKTTDDLIVVGPRSALPQSLLKPFDAQRADDADGLPAFMVNQAAESRTMIRFGMEAASGATVTAAQFESPFEKGKTVTIFTAESAKALGAGIHSFVRPEAWGGLQGARTYWDPREKRIAWQRSDERYTLGVLVPFHRIGRLGTKHPIAFAGLVVALVSLIAIGLAILLRRHFHTEHHQSHGTPQPML